MVESKDVRSLPRRWVFWVTNLIILFMVLLDLAVYLRLFRLHIAFENFYIHHWFTIAGTSFIALYTPIYYFLKRRGFQNTGGLLILHVLGNITAAGLISVHVTQELIRSPQSYPELGTGLVLIFTMIILVATGYLLRFRSLGWAKQLRWLHTAATLSFYLIIVIHALHGIELL